MEPKIIGLLYHVVGTGQTWAGKGTSRCRTSLVGGRPVQGVEVRHRSTRVRYLPWSFSDLPFPSPSVHKGEEHGTGPTRSRGPPRGDVRVGDGHRGRGSREVGDDPDDTETWDNRRVERVEDTLVKGHKLRRIKVIRKGHTRD